MYGIVWKDGNEVVNLYIKYFSVTDLESSSLTSSSIIAACNI